jgi:AP-1 complex subunit beta-1
MQDIFRRYPNSYESVIVELCAALEVLEEPDAKAAMVWVIGEYAERIDNADELLSYLLDNFLDEPAAVQLQLLTAAVKVFLKKPGQPDAQAMISTVLTAATQQTDNPDLRDRAYLYWRLLSAMPEVRNSPQRQQSSRVRYVHASQHTVRRVQEAHQVVLAEKPAIRETSVKLQPEVRDELLRQLSTLASVYHRLPASFVKVKRATVHRAEDLEAVRAARSAEDGDDGLGVPDSSSAGHADSGAAGGGTSGMSAPKSSSSAAPDGGLDLLGGLDEPAVRSACRLA